MTRRILLTVREVITAGTPIGRVIAESANGMRVEIEAPVAWLREAEEGAVAVMDISFHSSGTPKQEPDIERDVNEKFKSLFG